MVTIKLGTETDSWKTEDTANELEELVISSDVEAVNIIYSICDRPSANFLIGKGKVEEIASICMDARIDTVIFSHDFSGTQQRNLEEVIGKKTIDRTQLILDIFARHAKSTEGKLQVELAQLQYLLPRLSGKGVMLSRLGGGIGTRGPGEQKLETDRRKIRKRIDRLKNDLRHLVQHRKILRKKRKENAVPLVALVGYTNAGKSTLLNALTGSDQQVKDSLFTTLDPLSKSLKIKSGENIIISDTVGFLHNLPHHLIEAFKATLEEVIEADLLIHVLDISHPLVHAHAQAVNGLLKELGADKNPVVTALNKIDLVEDKVWLAHLSEDFPNSVLISAKSGENLNALSEKIQENFLEKMALINVILPLNRMDLVDLFYRQGQVQKIDYQGEAIKIRVNLPKLVISKYLKNIGIEYID